MKKARTKIEYLKVGDMLLGVELPKGKKGVTEKLSGLITAEGFTLLHRHKYIIVLWEDKTSVKYMGDGVRGWGEIVVVSKEDREKYKDEG